MEIIQYIFEHLDHDDLYAVRGVCQRWREEAQRVLSIRPARRWSSFSSRRRGRFAPHSRIRRLGQRPDTIIHFGLSHLSLDGSTELLPLDKQKLERLLRIGDKGQKKWLMRAIDQHHSGRRGGRRLRRKRRRKARDLAHVSLRLSRSKLNVDYFPCFEPETVAIDHQQCAIGFNGPGMVFRKRTFKCHIATMAFNLSRERDYLVRFLLVFWNEAIDDRRFGIRPTKRELQSERRIFLVLLFCSSPPLPRARGRREAKRILLLLTCF